MLDSIYSVKQEKVFVTKQGCCAINAKGEPFPAEPLIMALLLLSHHKIIDWLTKQISNHKSPVNNNNDIKKSEQDEPVLGRENIRDYTPRLV